MKTIYHQEKYNKICANMWKGTNKSTPQKLKKKINAIVSHASELIALSIYEQVLKLHQDEFY